ncbi:Membrane protein OS=Stutzerimonas stutzeri OX=316 GN=UF78_10185 PE=3 SV=1 [Stutzerimonas stutzeri]
MTPFDWQRILLDDFPLLFIAEVSMRALFAFVAVFAFLKISGRRGIRQLSVFELVIILTLGSAAGDVSFYEDVPLLPIIAVLSPCLGCIASRCC